MAAVIFFTVGQITEKSNLRWIEIILHVVLKFQFDDACIQREVSTKFNGKVDKEKKENEKKNGASTPVSNIDTKHTAQILCCS